MVASEHVVEFQTLVGVFGLISLLSHPDQFDCVLPSACHPLWNVGTSPNLYTHHTVAVINHLHLLQASRVHLTSQKSAVDNLSKLDSPLNQIHDSQQE
jgi:enterochelin esterase-like enzyme